MRLMFAILALAVSTSASRAEGLCDAARAAIDGSGRNFASAMTLYSGIFRPGDCKVAPKRSVLAECARPLKRAEMMELFGTTYEGGMVGIVAGSLEQCGFEMQERESGKTTESTPVPWQRVVLSAEEGDFTGWVAVTGYAPSSSAVLIDRLLAQ